MKRVAIIPAYNEAPRVARVLEVVTSVKEVDEVIVVDDGSTDGTDAVAAQVSGVRVVRLEENRGKGGAMSAGLATTDAPVVLFLDADLVGLQPGHVGDMLAPVAAGETDMTIGVFRGGRMWTDISQILVPYISGQRAMRREVFATLPDPSRVRSGIEVLLTHHARAYRYRVQLVVIDGVTHTMKEEKLGFASGVRARARMYLDILRVLRDGRS